MSAVYFQKHFQLFIFLKRNITCLNISPIKGYRYVHRPLKFCYYAYCWIKTLHTPFYMLDGEKHLISKDSWIIHVWLIFEISNLKSYLSFYLLRFQVSLVFLQCKYLEIIYCLPSFMLHTTMPFSHSLIVMQGPSGTLWVALFHLTNSLFYNLFDRLWIYLTIALSIKIVLYGFINSLPHLPSALVPSVKIIIITAA